MKEKRIIYLGSLLFLFCILMGSIENVHAYNFDAGTYSYIGNEDVIHEGNVNNNFPIELRGSGTFSDPSEHDSSNGNYNKEIYIPSDNYGYQYGKTKVKITRGEGAKYRSTSHSTYNDNTHTPDLYYSGITFSADRWTRSIPYEDSYIKDDMSSNVTFIKDAREANIFGSSSMSYNKE